MPTSKAAASLPAMLNNLRAYSMAYVWLTLSLLAVFSISPDFNLSQLSQGFRWRDRLVALASGFRYWAGDRVFNDAIVGKDGWFFYADDVSVRAYQHSGRFGNQDLRRMQRGLDSLNSVLAENQRMLLTVLIPDKSTVYAQYMPDEIPVFPAPSPADRFVQYMDAHAEAEILDLRPRLAREAATQLLYYKTDSHWNALGAYFGYAEIMRSLSAHGDDLHARPLSDFETERREGLEIGDLPRIMGGFVVPEERWLFRIKGNESYTTVSRTLPMGGIFATTENPNVMGRRLLVFGDSFSLSLLDLLAPDFSRVTIVPYQSASGDGFHEWIEIEQPDYVIIAVVERLVADLSHLLPPGRH